MVTFPSRPDTRAKCLVGFGDGVFHISGTGRLAPGGSMSALIHPGRRRQHRLILQCEYPCCGWILDVYQFAAARVILSGNPELVRLSHLPAPFPRWMKVNFASEQWTATMGPGRLLRSMLMRTTYVPTVLYLGKGGSAGRLEAKSEMADRKDT